MAKAMDSEVEEPRLCYDQCANHEKPQADERWRNGDARISEICSLGGSIPLVETEQNGIDRTTIRSAVVTEGNETAVPPLMDVSAGGDLDMATRISVEVEGTDECLQAEPKRGSDKRESDGGQKKSYPEGGGTGEETQRTTRDRSIFEKSKEACRGECTYLQPDNRQKSGKSRPTTDLKAQIKPESWAMKVRNGTMGQTERGMTAGKARGKQVGAGERGESTIKHTVTEGRGTSKDAGGNGSLGGKKSWGRQNRLDTSSNQNGLRSITENHGKKSDDAGRETTTMGQGALIHDDSEEQGWIVAGKGKGSSPLLPQVRNIQEIYKAICHLDDENLLPTLVGVVEEAGEGVDRAVIESGVGQKNVEAAEKVVKAFRFILEQGLRWGIKDAISALSVAGADEEIRSSRLKKRSLEDAKGLEGLGPIDLKETPFVEDKDGKKMRYPTILCHFTGICPTESEAKDSTWLISKQQSNTKNFNHVWRHEEQVKAALEDGIARYLGEGEGVQWTIKQVKVWQAAVNVTQNIEKLQLCGEACGRAEIEFRQGSEAEQRIKSLLSGGYVLVLPQRGPVLTEQWTGEFERKAYSRTLWESEGQTAYGTQTVRNEIELSKAVHDYVAGAIGGLSREAGTSGKAPSVALFNLMMAQAASQLQESMRQRGIHPQGISFFTWGSVSPGDKGSAQQNGTVTATRAVVSVRNGMPSVATKADFENLHAQHCRLPGFVVCRVEEKQVTIMQEKYQTSAIVVRTANGSDVVKVPMVDIVHPQNKKKKRRVTVEARASSDTVIGLRAELRENSKMHEAVHKAAQQGSKKSQGRRETWNSDIAGKLREAVCDEVEQIDNGFNDGIISGVHVKSIGGVGEWSTDWSKMGAVEFGIVFRSAEDVAKVFGTRSPDSATLKLDAKSSSFETVQVVWPAQAEADETGDGSTDDAGSEHDESDARMEDQQQRQEKGQPQEDEVEKHNSDIHMTDRELAPVKEGKQEEGNEVMEVTSPQKRQQTGRGVAAQSPGSALAKGMESLMAQTTGQEQMWVPLDEGDDESRTNERASEDDNEMVVDGLESRGRKICADPQRPAQDANRATLDTMGEASDQAGMPTMESKTREAFRALWEMEVMEQENNCSCKEIVGMVTQAIGLRESDVRGRTFAKETETMVTTLVVGAMAKDVAEKMTELRNMPDTIAKGQARNENIKFLKEAARERVSQVTEGVKELVNKSLDQPCGDSEGMVRWVESLVKAMDRPDIEGLMDDVRIGLEDGLWMRFWQPVVTKFLPVVLGESQVMKDTKSMIVRRLEAFREKAIVDTSGRAGAVAGSLLVSWVLEAKGLISTVPDNLKSDVPRFEDLLMRTLPTALDKAIQTCQESPEFNGTSSVGGVVEEGYAGTKEGAGVDSGMDEDTTGASSPMKKQKVDKPGGNLSREGVNVANILTEGRRRGPSASRHTSPAAAETQSDKPGNDERPSNPGGRGA